MDALTGATRPGHESMARALLLRIAGCGDRSTGQQARGDEKKGASWGRGLFMRAAGARESRTSIDAPPPANLPSHAAADSDRSQWGSYPIRSGWTRTRKG